MAGPISLKFVKRFLFEKYLSSCFTCDDDVIGWLSTGADSILKVNNKNCFKYKFKSYKYLPKKLSKSLLQFKCIYVYKTIFIYFHLKIHRKIKYSIMYMLV